MVDMPAGGVPSCPAVPGLAGGSFAYWQTQPTLSAMIATALSRMPIVWQCPAQVAAAFFGTVLPLTPTAASHPPSENPASSAHNPSTLVTRLVFIMAPR